MFQNLLESDFTKAPPDPNQMRWHPLPLPSENNCCDLIEGLHTFCGAGDPRARHGIAIHMYAANKSMVDRAFYNSDGDWLIVPQKGALDLLTEFGHMLVRPGEIVVIQRGIRFSARLSEPSRGYILEVYDDHFQVRSLVLYKH